MNIARRARYCFTNSVRLSVRLSVCLSVRHVVVLYLNKAHIVKLFPPSGSDIILVSDPQRRYKISKRSLIRGVKYLGVGQFFSDFR